MASDFLTVTETAENNGALPSKFPGEMISNLNFSPTKLLIKYEGRVKAVCIIMQKSKKN